MKSSRPRRIALFCTNFLPTSQVFVYEQLRQYRRSEVDVFAWRRFHPERFLPGAETSLHPRSYIPFGAGSRSCIGQGFAMLEAVLVIAQVLQRFRLELVDSRPVFLRPRITLAPARALRVRLQPRR